MSNTGRTHFKKGHTPWSKGKIIIALQGENNPSWKGGLPKCLDCNKQLASYVAKRCFKCRGLYLRGWHHTDTAKAKMRSFKGELNHHWRGGITPLRKKLYFSEEYKAWRKSVFERDKYICVLCGQKGGNLEADHIKPWAYFPELRFEIKNGRTLCKICHRKTDTYGRMKSNKYAMEL